MNILLNSQKNFNKKSRKVRKIISARSVAVLHL